MPFDCFLHNLYKVAAFDLTLYGGEILYALPCVSFRLIRNTGAKGRHSPMARRSTQRMKSPQPPDDRTYSAEVTGQGPQSPASSQKTRPAGASGHRSPLTQAQLSYRIAAGLSSIILCFWKTFCLVPPLPRMAGKKRAARGFPAPGGAPYAAQAADRAFRTGSGPGMPAAGWR